MTQFVTIDRPHEHVAHLQLNRPNVMNALNNDLVNDVYTALKDLDRQDDVRVIVFGGAGKAFCAGGDVSFLNHINKMAQSDIPGFLGDIFYKLSEVTRVGKPVIAVLHGYALGAGLALSLLCDIRIAGEKTIFGAEFPSMGIVPEVGLTHMLPALVGLGKALELALTARRFDASEALAMGLINRMVHEEQLHEDALAMACRMAELPPLALKWTKLSIRKGAESALEETFRTESIFNGICYASEDHREATSAFFEKRKPVFKGR